MEIRKYFEMEKSIFLVLFLALASWTLVEGSEQFKHSEGLVYAYAASLAYCPPELIMKKEWKLATKMTKDNGIEPLFAYSNNETLDYVIFTTETLNLFHSLIVTVLWRKEIKVN